MIITNASLEALRKGFNTLFQDGLGKATPVADLFTTEVTSTTKTETYGFLGDMPIFREWLGAKQVKSLEEKAYALTNRDFECTITVHKHKIEDDNLGLYSTDMVGIGEDAGQLKNRLSFAALEAGNTTLCYDGQYFFDTDHVVNGVTYNNNDTTGAVNPWYVMDLRKPRKPILYQKRKAPTFVSNVSAGGMNDHLFDTGEYKFGGEARGAAGHTYWQLAKRSTATLNAANFEAARAYAASIKNDAGQPIGIKWSHVVVGASNLAAAEALFEKEYLAGGESNTLYKKVQVIDASEWLA